MILRKNIEKVRSFCKFCEISLNVQRAKTKFKIMEPRSFYVCKNAVVPIIAILDCLELDMEVSDIGMETVKSNDCKRMLRTDRDASDMLAII